MFVPNIVYLKTKDKFNQVDFIWSDSWNVDHIGYYIKKHLLIY